jgi:hypothetical protein
VAHPVDVLPALDDLLGFRVAVIGSARAPRRTPRTSPSRRGAADAPCSRPRRHWRGSQGAWGARGARAPRRSAPIPPPTPVPTHLLGKQVGRRRFEARRHDRGGQRVRRRTVVVPAAGGREGAAEGGRRAAHGHGGGGRVGGGLGVKEARVRARGRGRIGVNQGGRL